MPGNQERIGTCHSRDVILFKKPSSLQKKQLNRETAHRRERNLLQNVKEMFSQNSEVQLLWSCPKLVLFPFCLFLSDTGQVLSTLSPVLKLCSLPCSLPAMCLLVCHMAGLHAGLAQMVISLSSLQLPPLCSW